MTDCQTFIWCSFDAVHWCVAGDDVHGSGSHGERSGAACTDWAAMWVSRGRLDVPARLCVGTGGKSKQLGLGHEARDVQEGSVTESLLHHSVPKHACTKQPDTAPAHPPGSKNWTRVFS